MKYIIVLGDGMADEPLDVLGDQTPLGVAKKPAIDGLAQTGEIGLVYMVPEGMSPGSDTANLSVMGYDPKVYYTGRSPLEALSIGVDLQATDVSLRCNLVTLSEEEERYEERHILDHSSSEISTEDAAVLVEALKEGLKREGYAFYVGTSYRHLTVWKEGKVVELVPPHDILTKCIGDYLPKDEVLRDMMEKSYDILVNHPINIERKKRGLVLGCRNQTCTGILPGEDRQTRCDDFCSGFAQGNCGRKQDGQCDCGGRQWRASHQL